MAQLDSRCLLVSLTRKRMICHQLWAENEWLCPLLAEAKEAAMGRRNPGDGVPPGVVVLDPGIEPDAGAVRTHPEELVHDAERRP